MAVLPLLSASFRVSLDTLRGNPLRTFLSTLGIVIGVASLVAVLSLGDGMEQFVRNQIGETTDLQAIGISARRARQVDGVNVPVADPVRFTIWPTSMRWLRAWARSPSAGATTSDVALSTVAGAPRAVQLMGTMPALFATQGIAVQAGRLFTDAEAGRARRAALAQGRAHARRAGPSPARAWATASPLGGGARRGRRHPRRHRLGHDRARRWCRSDASRRDAPPGGTFSPSLIVRAQRGGGRRWRASRASSAGSATRYGSRVEGARDGGESRRARRAGAAGDAAVQAVHGRHHRHLAARRRHRRDERAARRGRRADARDRRAARGGRGAATHPRAVPRRVGDDLRRRQRGGDRARTCRRRTGSRRSSAPTRGR